MAGKIVVIGSSNTDMVIKSGKLPAPGETILGGEFLMNPGGKGANQAVAAAKLGAEVIFVAKVGEDVFGTQAIKNFKEAGINTDFVFRDHESPSGVALILVDSQGENSISVASGANARLKIEEVEQAIELLNKNDIVLIQLEIPQEVVSFAIKKCFEKGAKVVLNPAPARDLDKGLFNCLSIITPNEHEAEFLTGITVNDLTSAEKAARYLFEKGVSQVLITLGSKGVYLFNAEISKLIPSPQVQAIDTTAAGDVFNGALVVGLSEGKSIAQAAGFACFAASVSVTRMGAQASAPSRSEVTEFLG